MAVFKADVKIYRINDVDKLKDVAAQFGSKRGRDIPEPGVTLDDITGSYLSFTVAGSSIPDLQRRVAGMIALSDPEGQE